MSIKPEQLQAFTDAFEEAARETLSGEQLLPRLEIDAALEFADIGMALMRELEILQPYGIGNPEPVFVTTQAEVCERKVFSAGVRYRLRQSGRTISGVIFGVGDDYPGQPGETIDVVYRLSENQWNGNTSVELKIAEVRLAAEVSSFGLRVSG